ncbi:hypothetical protein MSPP1_000946 [Malassezia sp. CBS 17886]|nr:hypothetical protein MSPP1_000946 [Malassezia sp. CBS 17886]
MSAARGAAARGVAERTHEPRIPLAVVDAPTQRFYAAAVFLAVQAWKFSRIVGARFFAVRLSAHWWDLFTPTSLFHALLLDFALVYGIFWLRIPADAPTPAASAPATGVRPAPRRVFGLWQYAAVFVVLALLDTVLLERGAANPVALALVVGANAVAAQLGWAPPGDALVDVWGGYARRVRIVDVIQPQAHISGQHTVHILPFGSARLEPKAHCLCLGPRTPTLQVPVVFNQTVPALLRYSITDLERGNATTFNVRAPKVTALPRASPDEARGDVDAPDVPLHAQGLTLRERKRMRAEERATPEPVAAAWVHYLTVAHTGLLRVERVVDRQQNAARILGPDMLVVRCPEARFTGAVERDFCPGDVGHLSVEVQGTPPLQLTYAHDGAVQTLSHIAPPDAPRLGLHGAASNPAPGYEWAQRAHIAMPLALDLDAAGAQTYRLQRVQDACGNAVDALGAGAAAPPQAALPPSVERHVRVQARAQVQFDSAQCEPGRPLKLLRGAHQLDLFLRSTPRAGVPDTLRAHVRFAPDLNATLAPPLRAADAWERDVALADGAHTLRATQPGTYSLVGVHSGVCAGDIGTPWMCEVVDVPPPSAQIHFESIDDPCAGTVGVKALSVLEGEPPFRLLYEVQRAGQPARRQARVVQAQTRDELEFWPSTEGPVTYRFLALDDANYRDVPLPGPSFTQVVHPLASASFAANDASGGAGSGALNGAPNGANGAPRDADAVVMSCGSPDVQADVAFRGTGPWDLTYAVHAGGSMRGTEHTVHGITHPRYSLNVPLPESVLRQHGRATMSLLRLRDGKGCERRLATRDLRIDTSRTGAAVGFAPGSTNSTISARSTLQLPLRLTGDAPWHVTYRVEGAAENAAPATREVRVEQGAAYLDVDAPGMYTLLGVRDAHCAGTVLAQDTHHVALRPRPRTSFAPSAGAPQANGTMVRAPVCAGTPDAVSLDLDGHAPVSVAYTVQGGRRGRATQRTFLSGQRVAPLDLATDEPGWHTYVIREVGDALYAPAAVDGARVRLEQMVLPRASARFLPAKRAPTLCVGDSLAHAAGVAPVQLRGTPPFAVSFALRPAATTGHGPPPPLRRFTATNIWETSYAPVLSADEFVFEASGAWDVAVEHVSDAHGCGAPGTDTQRIDVVDSAGIVPVSARTDFCVGETMEFVLQGAAPWTVHYTFHGKHMRATAHAAEFARTAEAPGVLTVHSAAHQQNQCRSSRAPTQCTVHALPSAHVSLGRNVVELLRQGSEAEIVFTLRGEPPFAFTYQRTQPVDTVVHPRVLETHTVCGRRSATDRQVDHVGSNEYRVRTTQEGTWSVVWIQDRWCQVGETSGPAAGLA